jgi:lipid-binding SYLF domain-containing protein
MTAEILSWSRSRGVFAGISLRGATLRQDLDDESVWKPYENQQIERGFSGSRIGQGTFDLNKFSAKKG